jgi:hypothetical protein
MHHPVAWAEFTIAFDKELLGILSRLLLLQHSSPPHRRSIPDSTLKAAWVSKTRYFATPRKLPNRACPCLFVSSPSSPLASSHNISCSQLIIRFGFDQPKQIIQPYSIEMCTSIQSTRPFCAKRTHNNISAMSSLPVTTTIKGQKRRRVSLERVVSFNPQVSLRCVFTSSNDDDSSWIDAYELRQMKDSARRLAKCHYINGVRSQVSSVVPVTASNPVRYEMNGESLRGMEHITDLSTGKLRQAAKNEAIKSVNEEQCRQLLVKALSGVSTSDAVVALSADELRVDTARLSNVYSQKTKAAVMYAKLLAEEDARVAAEILADDL